MLTKFAVTNYRGFKDRIEWDLSHPSNYEFNPHVIKDGVVKNGIVYGPNGSGKTNFSLARTGPERLISVWRCSILRIICLRNGKSRIITKISFMQEGKT